MKNSLIKLIFIFSMILIHASCTDCNKCKKDCVDCQVMVDTSNVDTSSILYTMDNQSVINLIHEPVNAPATALCIVDVPAPGDNPIKEFVLIPVDAAMHPIPNGNWMKGLKRCPPVCDITFGVGSAPLLSPVAGDERERIWGELSNVPQQVENSVVIPKEALLGFQPQDFMAVMVPDDEPINIMIVKSIVQNPGHESRVHISMQP